MNVVFLIDAEKLFNIVLDFYNENTIFEPETIYQCDWVAENSPEFLEKILSVIKPYLNLPDNLEDNNENEE